MKLSIWQQFSSNHSANYMIIGVFEYDTAASAAGNSIQNMVQKIRDWWLNHDVPAKNRTPSLVEKHYAAAHNINWKTCVDWLRWYPDESRYRDGVWRAPKETVFWQDDTVYVMSPLLHGDSTWQAGHQFVNLLQAMGATTYSQTDQGTLPDDDRPTFFSIRLHLTCNTPEQHTAITIARYLNAESVRLYPWATSHPFYARIMNNLPVHRFTEQARKYVATVAKEGELLSLDAHPELEAIEFLLRDVKPDYIKAAVSDKTVTAVNNNARNTGLFLSAFVPWARSQGCTVTYQFEQVRGYDDL